ncbi:MAG: gluconokinase [Opitutus sp.]
MVILLMGVAGSGKTTVGQLLAQELGWVFLDADDVHPPANIAKMAAGQPLTDADRAPWLAALRDRIENHLSRNEDAVVTCSALKARYRDVIVVDSNRVKVVHLTGTPELLRSRIGHRVGHFMSPAMLDSQLAALEAPSDALTLDVICSPAELVLDIRRVFHL